MWNYTYLYYKYAYIPQTKKKFQPRAYKYRRENKCVLTPDWKLERDHWKNSFEDGSELIFKKEKYPCPVLK